MIVILKPEAKENDLKNIVSELKDIGMDVQVNRGVECTVLGVLGNTYEVDADSISLHPYVDRVMRVSEPFKKANRNIPPGRHRDRRMRRRKSGAGKLGRDRRPLLGGERGADRGSGRRP